MLRGWIEIGLSNPNIFVDQSNPDIIIRTYDESNTNKIIIGNTSSNDSPNRNGAMYIAKNNVGFKKVPLSNIDLDVNGIISTIDARIASNLTIGYESEPGTLQLRGDLTMINNGTSNLIISNSNQVFTFTYGTTERIKATHDEGMFLNDNVVVKNNIYNTGQYINSDTNCNVQIASFEPVRSNASIFIDTNSNDIVIRGYDNSQRLLFGFGSNINSTMFLTHSNLSIANGALYASNIGIGTSTPTSNYRLHIAGSTRVDGDLFVNGTTTTINTDVQVTEQFSVSNNGTGPALTVVQYGAQPVVDFKDDDITVFKIADGGFVTIGSNDATTKLDVEGSATIRGFIYTSNIETSNINTSSFTSTLSTNKTIITSNLYSSNLFIGNQLIINSNGVITNSNFLPPLNTSNIVAGQFTSNFIRNDEIISSKLASNLVLKGTTTISSNAFIHNGDLRIYGSNDFSNITDQARVYLGTDEYFLAASKAGIVLQVPNTTYPFIIENNSGFVGLGIMDPQENLHVMSNVKVDGNQYIMTKLGVAMSNPSAIIDVYGDIQASSNIKSSVGTLGPSFSLIPESAFADINIGGRLVLDNTLEAGNPGNVISKPLFYGNSYLYQDASGENMLWNFARLLFRGCCLASTSNVSTFNIQNFVNSRIPQYSNITSAFNLSNNGSQFGYVTYATPWFQMTESNSRHIALFYSSNATNSNFRIGQVLIQFKT
jgi:hypothetical protein